MSHSITFDTLAFVKKLEASGIKPKHSEGITEALADVFENTIATLPTKAYIDSKLLTLKNEIIIWVVAFALVQIVLLSTIVFSIIKFVH
jgi:hypothetical protein